MLKVGVAKLDITPPVGVRLSGFGARTFASLAVHDPLLARALVFDNGETRIGMLVVDLLGVPGDVLANVRERVTSVGIDPQALLITAIHTHSGPVYGDDNLTESEKAHWATLPERLAAVLREAAADLGPARVGCASGWSAIGINRREVTPEGTVILGRNHFGPFDPEVGVVRIERNDGRPLACLFTYACHPVCLSIDNYLTSADFPGFAVHAVEESIPGVTGIFLNGACGNVNPREAAVDHGCASGGSFMIAERAGSALAREAVSAWRKAVPQDSGALEFRSRTVALPTNRSRAIRAAEDAVHREEKRAAARPPRPWNPYLLWHNPPDPERTRARLRRLVNREDGPAPCETQVIRVGPVTLIAWSGEVFCELGMEVKRRSPFSPTYVIGYANGSTGYVPTPEAFREGGYEPESAAHLADDAGLVLVEQSLALLNDMRV